MLDIVIFEPFYNAYSTILGYDLNSLIEVNDSTPKWKRGVASIANCGKRVVLGAALVAAFVVSMVWGPIKYCLYVRSVSPEALLNEDLNLLTSEHRADLEQKIRTFIQQKSDSNLPADERLVIPEGKLEEYVKKTMAYYARSYHYYGPVAIHWVHHLLKKASEQNRTVVFLARDGTPGYNIARKILRSTILSNQLPFLQNDKPQVRLAYVSRKIVAHHSRDERSKEIFRAYIRQLGIQSGDRVILADVGFTGSMINNIREMLPDIDIEFNYLISLTEKAKGFIANLTNKLRSVSYAGRNFGIWWLEDSHKGTVRGPSKLIVENGVIYPNTLHPIQDCGNDPLQYLLRHWSSKALEDRADTFTSADFSESALEGFKNNFDNLLARLKQMPRLLYLAHTD